MPRDRCGYIHDVSRFPDIGEVCCWRPVWKDSHRCIWHTDATNKPTEAQATLAPVRGERLDGAIVRESNIAGFGVFDECTLINADFTQTDVSETDFTGADLREVTFRDTNVRGATFTRTNLEDTDFHNADLRGARLNQTKLDEVSIIESRLNRATIFGANCLRNAVNADG